MGAQRLDLLGARLGLIVRQRVQVMAQLAQQPDRPPGDLCILKRHQIGQGPVGSGGRPAVADRCDGTHIGAASPVVAEEQQGVLDADQLSQGGLDAAGKLACFGAIQTVPIGAEQLPTLQVEHQHRAARCEQVGGADLEVRKRRLGSRPGHVVVHFRPLSPVPRRLLAGQHLGVQDAESFLLFRQPAAVLVLHLQLQRQPHQDKNGGKSEAAHLPLASGEGQAGTFLAVPGAQSGRQHR